MPTYVKIEAHRQTLEYYFQFDTGDAELWKQLVKECGDPAFDKDKPSDDAEDWLRLLEQCDVNFDSNEETYHSSGDGGYDVDTRMDDD